jgi:molybdopterin/thiamine biosynthesis adenylyltransferase
MSSTLALRGEHWDQIVDLLELPVETAGFVFASWSGGGDELTLLGRTIGWVADEQYEERTADSLVVRSQSYWPFLRSAALDRAIPIFVHTHPRMGAGPSKRDDAVDDALRESALVRTEAPFYVSLIVGGTRDKPVFTGRIYGETGLLGQLERLRVVGRRIRLLHAQGMPNAEVDGAVYDRQIRAFGAEGQEMLARLRVGVVGAGGTGSAVFEQLVRDGVRDITLVDFDEVTDTNVTRIHESGLADAGRPKVEVMAAAAERIGLGARVTVINDRLTPETAREFRHMDVIFGCTDDEKGRLILSKLALTHLIPVFDMAVAVDAAADGLIRGITGRVSTLLPGQECLLCRGRISSLGLAAEDLDDEERRRRAGEGYVPGLGERDPAVGTFTTLVATYAVNELLDRLFGYSEGATTFKSTELQILLANRRISYNSRPATGRHFCADAANYGRGDESTL